MRIHHLNCGTMCPVGGRLMDGTSSGVLSKLVCHCLLVETDNGLVLVDTGFGLQDVWDRHERLSDFFLLLNRPRLSENETARRQVERLGFRAEDVRHIVLTHLDFDHAGGISDFPNARVHLLADELAGAKRVDGFISASRYRARQWGRISQWRTYEAKGEPWFGFDAVRDLDGLPPEILLVPLVGHTWGHAGVAIQDEQGWILHAGDAYFYREEMNIDDPKCTPGLRAYQKMMEVDREKRLWNQRRLRNLIAAHSDQIRVFSAHDRVELDEAIRRTETIEESVRAQKRSFYGDYTQAGAPITLH